MFRATLDRMEERQAEVMKFAETVNRTALRLEDQIRELANMESFSEIAAWLDQTEQALEVQAARTRELGKALETIIRYYRSSEEKILDRLEEGTEAPGEGRLSLTAPAAPGRWSELLRF